MSTLSSSGQEELAYEDNTPTPSGWRRKLIPYIGKGLVPARTDVIFVAPTGEEIRSAAQLQRYLKKTKAGPSLSEFIWCTDETPQRSSRSASKRSKSPPKTMSKKKPAAKVPIEEAKANKRNQPEKESVFEKASNEDHKGPKKRAKKATHNEGKGVINGEPPPAEGNMDLKDGPTSSWPSKKEHEKKQKYINDNKKRKGIKSDAVNSNMTEDTLDVRSIEGQCENGEENLEINKNHEIMEENRKKKAAEQPVLPEAKDLEAQNLQAGVPEDVEAKDLHDHMKNEGVGLENDDATTTSVVGSDLSAEGMEADSDLFGSEEGKTEHEGEATDNQQGERANASEGS